MELKDGDVVAMAVKETPLLWRTVAEGFVTLSEGGAVATQHTIDDEWSLTTTGTELTEGRHYWEVELLSGIIIIIGISRPNLDPTGDYHHRECTDGWFIHCYDGSLCGNGKDCFANGAGSYNLGDRVGMLVDLDNGSLRFFKNGVQHGPGYAAGSVTGPVVAAVQMYEKAQSVRLLPNAEAPIDN
jgi:hypothetical protein